VHIAFLCAGLFFLPLASAAPTGFVMVEMQDGTKLATDYYLPTRGGPRFPVLMTRSTYGRELGGAGDQTVAQGYAVVVQDVRGFGGSEGEHQVFFADGWHDGLTDGADTVAWILGQEWCDGHIGTFGGSALGITQALLAPATKHIEAQSIGVATVKFYHHLTYQGGVWRKNLCEGWLTMLKLENTMALWKSHPYEDAFWDDYNAEVRAKEITAPAIHLGGWYDIFQQGTIDNFVSRQYDGGKGAKGNQRLIITPYGHGGYSEGVALKLPENAGAVKASHHDRAFFKHWLEGQQNNVMDMAPVYYYVMGDDTDPEAPGMEWRIADRWPPFHTNNTKYYLAQDGLLTTDRPSTSQEIAGFTYDPVNPFPTCGGQNLILPFGPFDQRTVTQGRTDLLSFSSAPLETPLEVTGHVKLTLFISTDAPDTDFTAKLLDIYPEADGREILMLDNIQRVKLRHGGDTPAPLLTSAAEVVEIEIDLWSISWVFHTGHRIGLHVSSSNYPRFEVNPNSGDDWPTDTNRRVAHNVVHMGRAYPSALVLPVRPADVEVAAAPYLNPEDFRQYRRKAGEQARHEESHVGVRKGRLFKPRGQ